MKLLRLKKSPTFDVFRGEGWYDWTRVLFDAKQNTVKILAGNHLNIKEKNEVLNHCKGEVEK